MKLAVIFRNDESKEDFTYECDVRPCPEVLPYLAVFCYRKAQEANFPIGIDELIRSLSDMLQMGHLHARASVIQNAYRQHKLKKLEKKITLKWGS